MSSARLTKMLVSGIVQNEVPNGFCSAEKGAELGLTA